MKKKKWCNWLALAAGIILCIVLGRKLLPGGIGSSSYTGMLEAVAAQPERTQEPVDKAYTAALKDFSFRSMTALYEGKDQENLLYSPYSLYMALSVLAEGSEDTTREELLELLALSDQGEMIDSGWLAEQSKILYGRLYQESDQSKFHIANSLWMAEEIQGAPVHWNQDYLKQASGKYYTSLFSADFTKPKAAQAMSQCISEQTNGLLVPTLETTPTQLFAIINTIYLKDYWYAEFHENNTKEDVFYREDGFEVNCDFMNRVSLNNFCKGDGYTRASLDLQQTGKVTVVLPDEGISVEEFLASPERLAEAFTGGEEAAGRITWQVPKITVKTEGDLVGLLQAMGASEIFGWGADFSGMTDQKAFVSQVQQGTKLIWDENGVEAAAYTYIGGDTGSAGPGREEEPQEVYMILNRPFLYAIEKEGVYLFIGVCGDPTVE